MATLNVGDKAPNFNLLDQDRNKVKLADFKGKKLLVFFYSILEHNMKKFGKIQ